MTTSDQVTKLRSIQDNLAVCLVGDDGQDVAGYKEIFEAMQLLGLAANKTLRSQAEYETRNP